MQGNSTNLFGEQTPANGKVCCKCKTWKPFSEYATNGRPKAFVKWRRNDGRRKPLAPDGRKYHSFCRPCNSESQKVWRKKNGKHWSRKRLYGITREEYQALIDAQDGACAICGDTKMPIDPRTGHKYDLAVDHDHKTGKVRELLCPNCNNGLGCFKDDPKLLHLAIQYLVKHQEKTES